MKKLDLDKLNEIEELKSIKELEPKQFSISGTLVKADSNDNEIVVENNQKLKYSIIVPIDKIKEIVLQHW